MRKGPALAGRPLRAFRLVGQLGGGDLRCVPDDAGVIGLAVPGLDVADCVALGGECGVVVVGIEVSDDGSVAEVRHGEVPYLHQPDC